MGRRQIAPGSWGEIKTKQLDDGSWEGRVYYRTLDGARKETRAQGKTKAKVVAELNRRLPELATTLGAPKVAEETREKLFRVVFEEWLEYEELKLPDHTKAIGTHTEHQRLGKRNLLPSFGDKAVGDISADLIFRWYKNVAASHAPLARNALSLLRQVLDHATNLGYIDSNPASTVKALRRKKKPVFAPEIDELKKFREAVVAYREDTERPGPQPSMLVLDVIDMILATGFRISEVLGLRLGLDIHLAEDPPIAVVNGAIKEKGCAKHWDPYPKSEAGRREMPLPKYAVDIVLRRMMENKTGSEFLFHTRTGRPNGPQDVHRALRVVREHAGLPSDYIPHALRKTYGTKIAHEFGIERAAEALGHAGVAVAERHYVKRRTRAIDSRDIVQAQYELIIGQTPPLT